MENLILPAQKDAFLKNIIESYVLGELIIFEPKKEVLGFNKNQVEAILIHFSRLGLITVSNKIGINQYLKLVVNVEAHDFLLKGGFVGQYELFKNTVEKLLLEVERLERVEGSQQKEVKEIKGNISTILEIIANAFSIGDSLSG